MWLQAANTSGFPCICIGNPSTPFPKLFLCQPAFKAYNWSNVSAFQSALETPQYRPGGIGKLNLEEYSRYRWVSSRSRGLSVGNGCCGTRFEPLVVQKEIHGTTFRCSTNRALKVTGIRGTIDSRFGYAEECSPVAWSVCDAAVPIEFQRSYWTDCSEQQVVQSEERVKLALGRCALCWSYNGLGGNGVSTQTIGRTDTRDGERSYQIKERWGRRRNMERSEVRGEKKVKPWMDREFGKLWRTCLASATSDGWGVKVGGPGWGTRLGVLVLGELKEAGM